MLKKKKVLETHHEGKCKILIRVQWVLGIWENNAFTRPRKLGEMEIKKEKKAGKPSELKGKHKK